VLEDFDHKPDGGKDRGGGESPVVEADEMVQATDAACRSGVSRSSSTCRRPRRAAPVDEVAEHTVEVPGIGDHWFYLHGRAIARAAQGALAGWRLLSPI
jgi:hypothetical protein